MTIEEISSEILWNSLLELRYKSSNLGPKLPLTQDWNYGEALRQTQGRKVFRYQVKNGQECVAIFQVSKIKALFTRINQGPLWITDSIAARSEALSLIKKYFFFLVWIPNEAQESGIENLIFKKTIRRLPWTSALINLAQGWDQIEKNFEGKWRNQLRQAEKHETSCQIVEMQSLDWQWFKEQYLSLQLKNSFKPTPLEFFDFYQKKPSYFLGLAYRVNDETQSVMIFVRHFKSWTYLAGLNNDLGRKRQAHNLLMKKAILLLKENAFFELDLGGIDSVNTPGIAHFKKGLGGHEYSSGLDYLVF